MGFFTAFVNFFSKIYSKNSGYFNNSSYGLISDDSALKQSTVYACVTVHSSNVASLPIRFFKKDNLGNKELNVKHPAYYVLSFRPNKYQTSYEFIEMLVFHLMLRGVAYARIYRDLYNNIVEMIPISPDQVRIELNAKGTDYVYKVTNSGVVDTLTRDQMLHIKGLHSDILNPVTPLAYARTTITTDAALTDHQGASFGPNSVRPGGVLESENKISEKAASRILDLFNQKHGGAKNASNTIFLDAGIKFKPLNMTNQDAQFLETRHFSVEDICRFFNMAPSMVHSHRYSTYSNAEQQALGYVKFSLRPILARIEAGFANAIWPGKELMNWEIQFDATALLAGDMTTISSALTRMVSGGVYTPNEARVKAGEDKLEDPAADKLYIQQNLLSVDEIGKNANMNQKVATFLTKEFLEEDGNG